MPSNFGITVMKKSCVALRSTSISGLVSRDGVSVLDFVAGNRFFNYCFKWSFVVSG